MKYFYTIAILLATQIPNFALDHYAQGDALYVWAPSGLNMRAEAKANAQKITKIPYAEQVIIVDRKLFEHPFSYTMAKGESLAGQEISWKVKGHWVKVEYKGESGYVFDAYLGQYPALSVQEEPKDAFDFSMMKEYGKQYWGGFAEEIKTTKLDYEAFNRDADKGRSGSVKMIFNNEAYVEEWNGSFSGGTNIFLAGASLPEAYHFFNMLTSYEQRNKASAEERKVDRIWLKKIDKDILFFQGETSEYSIRKVKGGVIISDQGGC